MKAVLADVDADRRHLLCRFATRKVQVMDNLGPGAKQIGEIKGAIRGNESAPRRLKGNSIQPKPPPRARP